MSGFTQLISWALTVLIATFLIFWLWNAVLVQAISTVNPIGFWQALGISILARLMFGPNIINEKVIVDYIPTQVTRALKRGSRR